MAKFELAIPITLQAEGGWSNNPKDPGAQTNFGIILKEFVQVAHEYGLQPTEDGLRNITMNQAKQIYKDHFWNKILGDQINNQSIANLLFDSIVNLDELRLASGNSDATSIKLIQRAVGVTDDGLMGPNTIKAINASNQELTFNMLKQGRIKYYNDLIARKPELSIFEKNWLHRVNLFNFVNN